MPNLTEVQVLVIAGRFTLTSYTLHPTHYLSFSPPAISLTSYSSLRILPLPAAVSVTLRAVLTMSESSPQYLLRPTRYRPCSILLALILAASYLLSYWPHLTCSHTRHILLAIVHATGVLFAIILIVVVPIVSCRICQLSFVSDTQSNATRVKTELLHVMIAVIDVMLGACTGNAKCSSSIYRCTLDIENITRLSHYA